MSDINQLFCSDLSNNPLVCDCSLTRLYLLLNFLSKLGNAGARCNNTGTFVRDTDNKFVNCTGNENVDIKFSAYDTFLE